MKAKSVTIRAKVAFYFNQIFDHFSSKTENDWTSLSLSPP
jgi:hypothetical protein